MKQIELDKINAEIQWLESVLAGLDTALTRAIQTRIAELKKRRISEQKGPS